jgi:hypothetical protein
VEDLRDKIGWYRSQLNAIEDVNNDLQCDVQRAREDLRCANNLQRGPVHRGRAHTGHMGYNTRDRSHEARDRPLVHSPRRPTPHHSSPVRPPSSMQLIDRIGSPETSQQPPHEMVMAVSVEEDETSKDKAQLPQQDILDMLMSLSLSFLQHILKYNDIECQCVLIYVLELD